MINLTLFIRHTYKMPCDKIMSRADTRQGGLLIFHLPYIIIEFADGLINCQSARNRLPEQTSKEQDLDDRI